MLFQVAFYPVREYLPTPQSKLKRIVRRMTGEILCFLDSSHILSRFSLEDKMPQGMIVGKKNKWKISKWKWKKKTIREQTSARIA